MTMVEPPAMIYDRWACLDVVDVDDSERPGERGTLSAIFAPGVVVQTEFLYTGGDDLVGYNWIIEDNWW